MSWSTMRSLGEVYDVREPDDFDDHDAAASLAPVPVYAPRWTRGEETDDWPAAQRTTLGAEPFDAAVDEGLPGGRPDAVVSSTTVFDRDSSSSASSADTPSSASDPFAGKLRRDGSLTMRRDRRRSSTSTSTSDGDEPFFSPETTVRTVSSRRGSGLSQYRHFEHRFHWSENIENGSPWVRHRTKEIFNHLNSKGLFDTQTRETLSNRPEEVSQGSTSDTARDDCNETCGDITYEVANKLCESLKKHNHNNNNDVVSESRCPLSEHFKWTKLYEELVNYGAQ